MMSDNFLNELNSRQREAVTSTEGRIRVVAGAGTGKTKALTCRYAYLVDTLGIDPANILCLTFTNKAATEMRKRISTMVGSGDYNDFVCTIDGFCVKFLRQEIYRLGFPKTFTILDEEDQKDLAKKVMDELGLKRTQKTVRLFLDGISADKSLNDYIVTYMLPGARTGKAASDQNLAAYIRAQMKNYALDFDDLENFTKLVLDRFPDAREQWQQKLDYIMVDEAQDCNADNWEIIEKLAEGHQNLFIVGDPDQAIYEWRGAKPDRFVQFNSDKDIVLDENYRSTPKILDVANSIISHNQNRIPKDLFTRQGEGPAVIHFHAKTEREEMEWVCSQIRKIHDETSCPYAGFAVLYRSAYLSQPLEQALLGAQLPYAVWGGTRFLECKEIKDCLAYLRLAVNQHDDMSFSRIVNVPSRKLGRKFMTDLEADSSISGKSLYETMKEKVAAGEYGNTGAASFVSMMEEAHGAVASERASDILNGLLEASGMKKDLRENQDEDRLENVDELVHSVLYWEEAHAEEDVGLPEYLQDISLYTNADYKKDTDVVKIMTIHQAKGLEFPYVFIIGLSEGIFPNLRTIREYKKSGEEEERRLMYVAVTRARKALFLTESEGYNVSTKMNKYPSRFLTEIRRDMFVTEGFVPDELWQGTRNLRHVLDEEIYGMPLPQDDGDASSGNHPFEIGDTVVHRIFGEGTVIDADKEYSSFRVRFSDGQTRQIRASFLALSDDLPE